MFGQEIVDVLESHPMTANIFRGVYSSNNLPSLHKSQRYPIAFIANTHENYKPGEHWVAFFLKSPKAIPEYFDSYGLPPFKKGFLTFLKQQRRDFKYRYNNKMLQSLFSDFCGQHSIYYVFQKSKGRTLNQIVHDFTDNNVLNDLFVKRFVERMALYKKHKLQKRKKDELGFKNMKSRIKQSQCSKCMMKVCQRRFIHDYEISV